MRTGSCEEGKGVGALRTSILAGLVVGLHVNVLNRLDVGSDLAHEGLCVSHFLEEIRHELIASLLRGRDIDVDRHHIVRVGLLESNKHQKTWPILADGKQEGDQQTGMRGRKKKTQTLTEP